MNQKELDPNLKPPKVHDDAEIHKSTGVKRKVNLVSNSADYHEMVLSKRKKDDSRSSQLELLPHDEPERLLEKKSVRRVVSVESSEQAKTGRPKKSSKSSSSTKSKNESAFKRLGGSIKDEKRPVLDHSPPKKIKLNRPTPQAKGSI